MLGAETHIPRPPEAGEPAILFVYLEIDRDNAAARVASRKGHFMPASLTDSQFADLEPPSPDEGALTLDATRDPADLVAPFRR